MADQDAVTPPTAGAAIKNAPYGGFMKERVPFIVATGGEFIGLYFWLYYWDQGSWVAATIVLWAGFLTERLAVLGWVKYFHDKMQKFYGFVADGTAGNDIKAKPKPAAIAHLLFICLTEITIWVVFVFVYERFGWVAAFAALLIGEQLEHSMELGLIARRPMRDYIPTWNALKITLLEAGGGIAWLWLVRHGQPQLGGLILLIGLSIEHVVQGNKIKLDLEQPFKDRLADAQKAAAQNAAPGGGPPADSDAAGGTIPASTGA